jgi:type VI secretion system protein ImpL
VLAYLITGAALLVWVVLSWFLATLLGLKGSDVWLLRGLLTLLGLIAAGFACFWIYRHKQAADAGGETTTGGATSDVDLLVHEAVRRLRGSNLGSGASLGKLPMIFFLGETGSVKTTTIVQSGLDPELLAGHAYQDSNILPTQIANIWYTRQSVFVDCGGDLISEPGRWTRLVRLTQPSHLSSAMSKKQQAPRAAVVCHACENFFRPGARESAAAAAKKLNARLQEVSRLLSINFPVYVLFTKFDRVPFFPEYAQNLTREEVSEVLGATLPVRHAQGGVYAEEESKRLGKAFDELFYSLAERRVDLLGRENQADRLPGVYEFPREMRKMRTVLVDFLVDLARPSQLQSNPFLRGFYFSGVRAVVVDDVAPAGRDVAAEPVGDAGATRMFSAGQLRQPQATAPAYVARSRKVPQWTFLSRLFNDVILKDRVALSASGISSRVNLFRRVALIMAMTLCLVFSIGLTVSFFENRALETELAEAARQVPTTRLGPGQLASANDLQRLERLRHSVAILSRYKSEGHPWRTGWFLYIGDRLYPEARRLYFDRFYQMMFGGTQSQVLSWLRGVADSPAPNQPYDEKTYNALKAYLITASYPTKSTQAFLSPVLMSYWSGNRDVEAQQLELAKEQFDFYATELTIQNPYSSTPLAGDAVAHAQRYLKNFAGIDRYYLPLLSEADGKLAAVTFNGKFKGSREVLVNDVPVRQAFTKEGFAFVQTALQQPQRYFNAEEWVLGKGGAEALDTTQLKQQLSDRYKREFVATWYKVLKDTRFLGYGSLSDADNKLRKVADPSSPLLELFWFVSHNTDVDLTDIKAVFEPVRDVVPAGATDKYIQPPNQQYMKALTALSTEVTSLAGSGGLSNKDGVQKVSDAAKTAENEVGNIAGNFPVRQDPPVYQAVRPLLDAPITNVNNLMKFASVAGLNKSGQDFCHDFSALAPYYPFNPSPNAPDLPLKQFNDMFAPGGAFSKFADTLKDYVTRQGSEYVANDSGTVHVNRDFLTFFNRAAGLSEALFAAGSPSPHFSYTLKQMPSNVDNLELKIGSDTLSGTGQAKTFSWTGNEPVQVTAKGDTLFAFSGPWAVFRFVADARAHSAGSATDLEWILEANGHAIMLPSGKQKSFTYELQVNSLNPFRSSEWSMRCVSKVAH